MAVRNSGQCGPESGLETGLPDALGTRSAQGSNRPPLSRAALKRGEQPLPGVLGEGRQDPTFQNVAMTQKTMVPQQPVPPELSPKPPTATPQMPPPTPQMGPKLAGLLGNDVAALPTALKPKATGEGPTTPIRRVPPPLQYSKVPAALRPQQKDTHAEMPPDHMATATQDEPKPAQPSTVRPHLTPAQGGSKTAGLSGYDVTAFGYKAAALSSGANNSESAASNSEPVSGNVGLTANNGEPTTGHSEPEKGASYPSGTPEDVVYLAPGDGLPIGKAAVQNFIPGRPRLNTQARFGMGQPYQAPTPFNPVKKRPADQAQDGMPDSRQLMIDDQRGRQKLVAPAHAQGLDPEQLRTQLEAFDAKHQQSVVLRQGVPAGPGGPNPSMPAVVRRDRRRRLDLRRRRQRHACRRAAGDRREAGTVSHPSGW